VLTAYCIYVATSDDCHKSDVFVDFYTIRYDTRCYFNVRSKADISQLNLLHGA